jgi:hypothetical protein
MNAVLLPQISTKALSPEPEESATQSDDSSDSSSDSDELCTLNDSDDEAIPNIQRINLLFMGLEDPDYNYNATEDELLHN